MAGTEGNRNCKASLEESSRCPYLFTLVPAPCPGGEEVEAMEGTEHVRVQQGHHPISAPCALPAGRRGLACLSLVHSSSARGHDLSWQMGGHLSSPSCCIAGRAPTSTPPSLSDPS